ncbi:hypothetical protein [Lacinutrix sp. Hel_I_90]|uniref:hypothetical protein n=1 Tax=Lacinutrix sp. Hel_I_90 TaxID=1249999 RepID=UPI0005C7FA30|nr:hypothetical protein [Lacinutrix sp. Hel_I_90]
MSIKSAIKQINKEIKSLEDERTNLQNQCNHKKYSNVEFMWRVGATVKVDMCKDCNKVLEPII